MLAAAVAHRTKGRVRLKFPGIKGNAALGDQIRSSILNLPGVTNVDVNPLTGSVIIHHKNPDHVSFVMLLARHGEQKQLFLLEISAPPPTQTSRQSDQRSALRDLAGHSLLALGVAGVLLPVVPGTPFLLAGAAVLGPEHPVVSSVRRWLKVIQ